MAQESVDQQAAQNAEMSRLNREVAAGTRQLVEADAEARQQLLAAQQQLQVQQQELSSQRDALEAERKAWAGQRRTESMLAPLLTTFGAAFLALLPLALCASLLHGLARTADAEVGELLIHELTQSTPLLLPAPAAAPERPALEGPAPTNEPEDAQSGHGSAVLPYRVAGCVDGFSEPLNELVRARYALDAAKCVHQFWTDELQCPLSADEFVVQELREPTECGIVYEAALSEERIQFDTRRDDSHQAALPARMELATCA
jgi:hypothetical protein